MKFRNVTQPLADNQWKSLLGKQHENKCIVHDEFKMENEVRDEIEMNNDVDNATMEMRLHTVSDILINNNQM